MSSDAERVAAFDAKLRAAKLSDNDRHILHRFRAMLAEEARLDGKAALGPEAGLVDITIRPRVVS